MFGDKNGIDSGTGARISWIEIEQFSSTIEEKERGERTQEQTFYRQYDGL